MTSVKHSPHSVMASHENDIVTLESINAAAVRIKPFIHKTPVMTCHYFNELAGRKLFFKCENFQKAGSFKIRGGTNSILRLKEEKSLDASSFVAVTHSSGNHAQALALATTVHGIECKIVVPSNAPQVKKDATKGYGATIIECEPTEEGRYRTMNKILDELDGRGEYISPADHPFMMEGQGTIALEMIEQIPNLDAVIACCSSGGLLSGIAVGCKQTNKNIQVFGAEPKLADDTARSFQAKKRIVLTEYPSTIADGLRMSVGEHTWPVIRDNITDVITVTEDEIVRAMFLLWERMKLVVEPSGATAFAAVLSEQFKNLPAHIQNVGITLSGGNVDLTKIPWMLHPGKYDISL